MSMEVMALECCSNDKDDSTCSSGVIGDNMTALSAHSAYAYGLGLFPAHDTKAVAQTMAAVPHAIA